jgi:hypothetical protein
LHLQIKSHFLQIGRSSDKSGNEQSFYSGSGLRTWNYLGGSKSHLEIGNSAASIRGGGGERELDFLQLQHAVVRGSQSAGGA